MTKHLATEPAHGLFFRTILVPHDFTAEADDALQRAVALAQASGGNVHLLHVLPYPTGTALADRTPLVWADLSLLDARRAAKARLLALGQGAEVPVVAHVAIGTPAGQICETAQHIGADLIVLTTHARPGLASVAARTVRRARCPVLALRGEPRDELEAMPERELH